MTRPRLGTERLATLPASVARPGFDRHALQAGIVHLGLGAFARAHLAAVNDAALAVRFDPAWGLCGASLRQPDTRDALLPQDGLYTLSLREGSGERLQVIGSLTSLLVAPDDTGALPARIAAGETRIVSLTITEKGYTRDAQRGGLARSHADVLHDLATPATPRSAIGVLVRGLALRRQAGLGGVTLLSLDNLPANGDTLQRLVFEFASAHDPSLADWIAAHCSCPNSMVDRIVPRTTEADRQRIGDALGLHDAWPVVAEPFLDWVVEDRFAAGRPDWAAGGARFVEHAAPWETLKLRLVNGAHSAIAYLALRAGWQTVDQAIAQPALWQWVQRLWRDELAPTLPALPGLDIGGYCDRLLARFANPALAHRCAQIAMDGSQKLPPRWLAAVRQRLAAGAPVRHLALAVGAWWLHVGGTDQQGAAIELDDPLAEALRAHWAAGQGLGDARAEAAHCTGFTPVFGDDLAQQPAWVEALASALQALRADDVAGALARRVAAG